MSKNKNIFCMVLTRSHQLQVSQLLGGWVIPLPRNRVIRPLANAAGPPLLPAAASGWGLAPSVWVTVWADSSTCNHNLFSFSVINVHNEHHNCAHYHTCIHVHNVLEQYINRLSPTGTDIQITITLCNFWVQNS